METAVVKEGRTSFSVPVQDPNASFPPGSASIFFNRRMEINRDTTILLLSVLKPRDYLDAMGATGVRGLRVANECGIPVTINDRDPDAVAEIKRNAEPYGDLVEVSHADSNVIMSERRFDAVDLDPFGTPAPFIDAAAKSAHSLLFITATDTAPLCGAHLKAGMRRYYAKPRNTEYHSEVGLRILLGFAVREIVKYDRSVEPVFCFAREHFVRLHLRLTNGAQKADRTLENMGYIMQCPKCAFRSEQRGMLPEASVCPECGASLVPVGPLWLGSINNREILSEMAEALPGMELGKSAQIEKLLTLCGEELDTSSFYDYHRLSRTWKVSPPAIDVVISRLREDGYAASRTHYTGTGLKTDAPLEAIHRVLRPL